LLLAGLLADAKSGKYFPIATFGCVLLTAPFALLLNSPQAFIYFSGATYFLGGFFLIYNMTSLVTIAHKSRRPVAITTLNAFLFFFFSGAGAFTSGVYIYTDSIVSLAAYVGVSVLLLAAFYLSGGLQPGHVDPAPEEAAARKSLEEMAKGYGVTNREAEVLWLLIDGKSTDEIAEAMSITKNSVQNYISSLFAKTGIKSRAGLIARFSRAKP